MPGVMMTPTLCLSVLALGAKSVALEGPYRPEVSQDTTQSVKHPERFPPPFPRRHYGGSVSQGRACSAPGFVCLRLPVLQARYPLRVLPPPGDAAPRSALRVLRRVRPAPPGGPGAACAARPQRVAAPAGPARPRPRPAAPAPARPTWSAPRADTPATG